jgi:predicted nucleic acid-binding protein
MAWCFADQADRYSDRVLEALSTAAAVVPGLWALEVANVLAVGERRGHLLPDDSRRFLEHLAALPIAVDPAIQPSSELLALARAHGISAYDSSYLLLAMRAGLPIATRDRDLRTAARRAKVASFAPP